MIALLVTIARSQSTFHELMVEGQTSQAHQLLLQLQLAYTAADPYMFEHVDLENPSKLQFQLLLKPDNPSTDIVVLVAGFTSELEDKRSLWLNLVNQLSHSSDKYVYALNYHSSSVGQLQKNGANLINDLTSLSLIRAFFDLWDNQFIQANLQARNAGRMFGLLLPILFPGAQVQLVAYSMGTQLVAKALSTLFVRYNWDCISDVILMGGSAEAYQLEQVADKFRIANFWSRNDMVLEGARVFLIKDYTCVGKGDVKGVLNFEISDLVLAHSDYHTWQAQIYALAHQKLG